MALILTLIHLYNINPKTKQLHIKERLIQPCVFSGGGTLCVLRQILISGISSSQQVPGYKTEDKCSLLSPSYKDWSSGIYIEEMSFNRFHIQTLFQLEFIAFL